MSFGIPDAISMVTLLLAAVQEAHEREYQFGF